MEFEEVYNILKAKFPNVFTVDIIACAKYILEKGLEDKLIK